MSTYTIAATGPDDTRILIARDTDGLSREEVSDLTADQRTAYEQVKTLVRVNDAGNRDAALALLATCFTTVELQDEDA